MKKLTLIIAFLCSISAFSMRYLVQANGLNATSTWTRAAVAGETKVTLPANNSLSAWYNGITGSLVAGDEIWFAAGTYINGGGITLKSGVSMYGGFAGTETAVSQRSKVSGGKVWKFTNVTKMDGGSADKNCFATTASVASTYIDGFTITKYYRTSAGTIGVGVKLMDNWIMQNCIVTDNKYTLSGTSTCNGVGVNITGSGQLLNSWIYNNQAIKGTSTGTANGAGVSMMGKAGALIKGCLIENNTATTSGGGIYCVYATLASTTNGGGGTIDSCIIRNNTASTTVGGGIRAYSDVIAAPLYIKRCTIADNTALGNGGGLYVDFFNNTTPQNISIEDCSITGNTAGTGGGGIYLNGGVYNPIKNCVINDNKLSADNDGAALYANKVVTLQNCVFANNSIFSGSTNKNIVRLVIESSNVYNCTFARNNSSTGGSTLNLTGVASTVTNCVFWGNTSPLILNSNLSTLSFNATDGVEITGASVSDNITTLNSTTNNTFVSPTTFQGVSTDATTKAQIAAADWSLMLGSPAINVGTDLSIATDLLGNPRPTGASAVDIGAYEGIFIADDKSISLYSTNSNINVLNMGNLTVNAAKTLNRVTIEAGGKINVSSGFPITAGIVTLKAAKDATTFNVKLDAAITATSVRLFKTIDDSKWYFMAFPCDVAVAGITKSDGTSLGTLGTDWFIKYYDGAKRANDGTGAGITNWVSVTSGTLTANRGYIFGLSTGTAETELLIPLNTSILAAEIGKSIAVEANTGSNVDITNHGWNLIGQPYLSQFVSQTGSDAPFMIMPNADGKTYSIKGKVAGTLPQINPFAAYFVQASGNGNINFGLTGRQSIPASVTNNMSEIVKLNLTTTTGNDETYLVMDNDQSPDYQIGMDMVKWLGTGTDIPQVYTQLNGVYYAFNSLPMNDVSNLPIGIYTKNAGNTTLSVNAAQAPSLSKLLLTDLSTSPATVTDLLISNYSFTATAGTDNSRFAITAKRVPTASVIETEVGAPNLLINNSKLTIQNLDKKTTVRVLDAIGRIVTDKVVNNNTMEISLPIAGMYIVQIESGAKNWTRKFVVQ